MAKKLVTAMVLATASFASMAVWAEPVELAPYKAEYSITRGGSDYGEGQRYLTQTNAGEWQLYGHTDISWFILSDERTTESVFRVNDEQDFIPIDFQYKREGTGSDRAFHASFDAETHQAVNVASGKPIDIKWQGALYDEGSVAEKLRLDVAAEREPLSYAVIDEEGHSKTYRFQRIGEETISTPYGQLDTIKVERVRDNNKRETYYWFAPEMNYLLVQLQQFKEGDEQATMALTGVTYPKSSED